MADEKKVKKDYVVFQGSQPVFSDSDEDTCSHFMHARKVECKRQGIDVNAKEHALEIR